MDPVPASIPWYKSNVLRALLTAGVAFAAKKAGVSGLAPEDASGAVDTALDVIQGAAGLWAVYARVKQPTPPVTMSKNPPAPSVLLLVMSIGLMLASAMQPVEAQTVKFTAAQTVNANGSVIPVLTWCSETVASAGATCTSGTAAAVSCTASGDWTGIKAAAGSETLPAITSGKTYVLECNWPGQDTISLSWTPPTTNDDGSPLTDLAGFHAYYGTSPTMSNNQVKDIPGAGTTSTVLGPGLAAGTWYIVMDAYNASKVPSVKVPAPPLQKVLGGAVKIAQSVKLTFPNPPSGPTVK